MFKDDTGVVYNWVVNNLNNGESYPNNLTVGIIHDNIIIAGIIYSKVEDECFMSIYAESPRWCSRKTLSTLFITPFEVFNSKIVKCATSQDNKRINKFLKGLGFDKEETNDARSDGSRLILYSIDRDELYKKRWFRK